MSTASVSFSIARCQRTAETRWLQSFGTGRAGEYLATTQPPHANKHDGQWMQRRKSGRLSNSAWLSW
ncbi:MAG: hypothetical protein ACREEV_04030, partial [Dongiaceae bacterium]